MWGLLFRAACWSLLLAVKKLNCVKLGKFICGYNSFRYGAAVFR